MQIIKKFYHDFETASDAKEQYDRCQIIFKGKHAESNAVLEHMQLDYVPKIVRRMLFLKMNMMNNFLNYWFDFKRISFLTLVMIIVIIYLIGTY